MKTVPATRIGVVCAAAAKPTGPATAGAVARLDRHTAKRAQAGGEIVEWVFFMAVSETRNNKFVEITPSEALGYASIVPWLPGRDPAVVAYPVE